MSRSKKKPIIKDKPRNYKRTSAYWRPIRRIWNQIVNSYKYEKELYPFEEEYLTDVEFLNRYKNNDIEFPNPKTIINDYDYCDYIRDYENMNIDEKYKIKLSRK